MARIKKIQIENFRGIRSLEWIPSSGVNCLIGHGDSGKSTILDAIDMCLGFGRNRAFADSDFYKCDHESPIRIDVTFGQLPSHLLDIESLRSFLRGFNCSDGAIDDEPAAGLETVLTMRLTVGPELDPTWTLYSERANAQGATHGLTVDQRQLIAPTRLDASTDRHLSWGRGSVMARLVPDMSDAQATLIRIARAARDQFGSHLEGDTQLALDLVLDTATRLGVPIGDAVQLMLSANAVSIHGGSLALHDAVGVPLAQLGVGSKRILIAGLLSEGNSTSSIVLVDEIEHGLEPHRIIRFLHSLGAKDSAQPFQVICATHSQVALQELGASQLYVLRAHHDRHSIHCVGDVADAQGAIRHSPHAFLAPTVLVCEGPSEIGFIRGLDQHFVEYMSHNSVFASGLALANAEGVDKILTRAQPLTGLGYRVGVFRDSDAEPDQAAGELFNSSGGTTFKWPDNYAIEDAIFAYSSDMIVRKLVKCAADFVGFQLVESQLRNGFGGGFDLESFLGAPNSTPIDQKDRAVLSAAAKSKQNAWFKTIGRMESVARDLIGPDLDCANQQLAEVVGSIFEWVEASPE